MGHMTQVNSMSSMISPQNMLLEEKLAKYSVQLGELEDLAGENRELQQAVLKKDSAMEELEKRLAQEKEDAEVWCRVMKKVCLKYVIYEDHTIDHCMKVMI